MREDEVGIFLNFYGILFIFYFLYLQTSGQPENVGNIYEHNFDGLYCICHRPYPDPEREGDAYEMIQCNICEDWFHSEVGWLCL